MTIVVQSTATNRDYTWLKGQIAAWMHRSDLTGEIPDLIYLAEIRIRSRLKERVNDFIGTISTVINQQYAVLPSDLVSVKSLSIPGVQPNLEYIDPDKFNALFDPTVGGQPRCYTIVKDQLYLGPTPDAVYTLQAMYQADVPNLTDLSPLNSILAKWPNVYLFSALTEAADYSRNLPLRDSFNLRFLDAIDGANLIEFNKSGPLRVRVDYGVNSNVA